MELLRTESLEYQINPIFKGTGVNVGHDLKYTCTGFILFSRNIDINNFGPFPIFLLQSIKYC